MTANNVSNLRPIPRPKIQNMVAVATHKDLLKPFSDPLTNLPRVLSRG